MSQPTGSTKKRHIVFAPERLRVYVVTPDDVDLFYALWTDPRVMRNVGFPRGLVDYLFTHTRCSAVEATPNVENSASIKMQEAVGGVCVGEDTFQVPESRKGYAIPVHHYIYRVYRENWTTG